jgi:DNA-directed RNA polymerase omega subunit
LITPGLETHDKKFGSRYDLVILAAQRAKQIQEGASPLIRTKSNHPLTIALEEIEAGVYPPPAREAAPKNLDEAFIGAALAEQDLTDLHSRFDSGVTQIPETIGGEASNETSEDEEAEDDEE